MAPPGASRQFPVTFAPAQGPTATLPFGLDLSNAVYLQPGK